MKIAELKTFVVGNPPPAFGGRYFLFLKLRTACGIEGVGEVYAASFGPEAIVPMIQDVFERHVMGADPFRIEALWRNVYGRGYTLRPDVSLMGVLSGIEMALWDIVGKAVGKPVYELLGGKVHERLRSYTYLYPDEPGSHAYSDSPVYSVPHAAAERALKYVAQGFTAVKFDPAGPYSTFDPRQPSLERLDEVSAVYGVPAQQADGFRAVPALYQSEFTAMPETFKLHEDLTHFLGAGATEIVQGFARLLRGHGNDDRTVESIDRIRVQFTGPPRTNLESDGTRPFSDFRTVRRSFQKRSPNRLDTRPVAPVHRKVNEPKRHPDMPREPVQSGEGDALGLCHVAGLMARQATEIIAVLIVRKQCAKTRPTLHCLLAGLPIH